MSTFLDVREQIGSSLQKYNYEVLKEPRGTIRILQLVFALITAVVLRFYEGYIDILYCDKTAHIPFDYPFDFTGIHMNMTCNNLTYDVFPLNKNNDFSSEAEFLFSACWVSALYSVIVTFVYVKFREEYESNGNIALADFLLSVLLAVFWISSFGAWGYGQSEMKNFTHPDLVKQSIIKNYPLLKCTDVIRGSVAGLTVTLILSFLNFFLWAAGLWFLYKETPWYLQFQRA